MTAFADLVRAGKVLYIGVSEWSAEEIEPRRARQRPEIQLVSNQPQYSMLWRVIEAEVVPDLGGARHRADRLVADRPGRAHRQVPAGPAPPAAAARARRAAGSIQRLLNDDVLTACSSCSRSPTRSG